MDVDMWIYERLGNRTRSNFLLLVETRVKIRRMAEREE